MAVRDAVRPRGLPGPSHPVADGLLALWWEFLATIVASFLFGLAVRGSGKTPALYLKGVRPVADLINPDVFWVIAAVLAGLAAVVSLTEARANALIGVFISVTTIPAAASAGVSIAYTSWADARGSVPQLLLNVILLIAAGAAGLRTQRAIWGSSAAGDAPGLRWLRRWDRDRAL